MLKVGRKIWSQSILDIMLGAMLFFMHPSSISAQNRLGTSSDTAVTSSVKSARRASSANAPGKLPAKSLANSPSKAPAKYRQNQAIQTVGVSKSRAPVEAKGGPKPQVPSYGAKAKAYFDAGRFDVAIQFAAAQLKRNPNNDAMVILMARSYYQLGNSARAAKLFVSIKPEDIPASAAAEYALAMFASKRYRLSAAAWQRVPTGHPYLDIIKFYSGVSYMYLRQYAKASQMLRSARKLPGNLKSERRRLLDEVEQLQERSRNGLFSQEQSYAYQAQPRYPVMTPWQDPSLQPPSGPVPGQTPGPQGKTSGPPSVNPAKPVAPPPPPSAGFSFTATPTVTYENSSEKTDKNGYSQTVANARKPTASMPMSLKYLAMPRSFGGQSYLALSVTPGYDDSESSSTVSSLSASADDAAAVQSNTSLSESHSYNQTLFGLVEGLYPVSDPVDVLASYKTEHTYVSASPKKDYSVVGPTIKATIEGDTLKLTTTVSMFDTDDQSNVGTATPSHIKTETTIQAGLTRNGDSSVSKLDVTSTEIKQESQAGTKSVLSVKANWDKTLNDFSLGLGGSYAARSAYEGSLLSNSQSARGEKGASATLAWSGPFGIVLTLGLNYGILDNLEYKATVDGQTTIIPSSGTSKSYSILASLPIFGSFGGLDLSYRYIDRTITPGAEDEATNVSILKNFWNQSTTTSVKFTARYPL